MSIIAVSKIPFKWSIGSVMNHLLKIIKGPFEALNFEVPKGSRDGKICYLRLSERLDPVHIVEKINRAGNNKMAKLKLTAYIPRRVPDMALAAKPKIIPLHKRRRYNIPEIYKPLDVLVATHIEIMTELQSKYTGLYNLSKKTGHKLLAEIAQIVFKRINVIMETNSDANECFKLTKYYRKLHPHFGDFQFILSTLHKIQDAEGVARDQIVESELASVSAHAYVIDNIPYDKVKQACNKYSDRIVKKVNEHIESYDCEINETDKEDDIARKRVREEFKKIAPYMPMIIKQVINKYFVPQKSPFHRVRIYGEPFLPPKDQMMALTKRYRVIHVKRSNRMYNLLKFNVPPDQYTSLMTMDGTVIGGARLIIRSSDIPLYKISESLKEEMAACFGTETSGFEYNMEVDENDVENWDEDVAV